jgi:hypothetical protein
VLAIVGTIWIRYVVEHAGQLIHVVHLDCEYDFMDVIVVRSCLPDEISARGEVWHALLEDMSVVELLGFNLLLTQGRNRQIDKAASIMDESKTRYESDEKSIHGQ